MLSNFFDIGARLKETARTSIPGPPPDSGAAALQPSKVVAMAVKVGKPEPGSGAALPVQGLVQTVLETLGGTPFAGRGKRLGEARAALVEASCADGAFSNERLRDVMESLEVSDAELTDVCIPDAARDLGESWVNDTMSFAQVSRASARLHGFCRFLEEGRDAGEALAEGFSILLVSLRREDHVIGPAVLARQLRRTGNTVALMSNCTVDDLVGRLGAERYDCLMISLSSLSGLERVATAVRRARRATGRQLPIFLGGAVLEHGRMLQRRTGADLVTKDVAVALDALRQRRNLERGASK